MTPLERFQEQKRNEALIMAQLNQINKAIKSDKTREEAYQQLLLVEECTATTEIKKNYIRGKYWCIRFRNSHKTNINWLTNADFFFERMNRIAKRHKTGMSEKEHFVRLHCKVLLAKYSLDRSDRDVFLSHAKFLLKKSIEKYGSNDQLTWIKTQFPKR